MKEKNIWQEEREVLTGLEREDMVEELIRRYRPMVYAAARRLAPGRRTDEDLLQCGLIGLWKAAEKWDEQRPFPPLARRCVENEMLTYLRRLSCQARTVPLGQTGDALSYEEDWSAVEARDAIERATEPDSLERRLLLAVAEGYTVAQAAEQVGLPRQTAKRKLRRAGRRMGYWGAVAKQGKIV